MWGAGHSRCAWAKGIKIIRVSNDDLLGHDDISTTGKWGQGANLDKMSPSHRLNSLPNLWARFPQRNMSPGSPSRFQYPGAIYHLMARGDGGETVFEADDNRLVFLKRLDGLWQLWLAGACP